MRKHEEVLIDGKDIHEMAITPDQPGPYTLMNYKSIFWYVIKRGPKLGVRIRDTLSHVRSALTHIPAYPISENWKIPAKFTRVNGDSILITNAVGIRQQTKIEGFLDFRFDQEPYKLTCLDGGPNQLYIIMADHTTGVETYGGGRFLYVDRPKTDNDTWIDFNKAYNPPCVFTDYATCPLPPKANHLPFSVSAGEKVVEGH